MEERNIYDAFPGLAFSTHVDAYLQNTKVTRIIMFNEKKEMEVYLSADHLIDRRLIEQAEYELARFLFPDPDFRLTIKERFNLSALYTPEKILDGYWESIAHEIGKENPVNGRLLKRGAHKMKGNVLWLNLPDMDLSRDREKLFAFPLKDKEPGRINRAMNLFANHLGLRPAKRQTNGDGTEHTNPVLIRDFLCFFGV